MAGGKRIRPILSFLAAEALGGNRTTCLKPAIATEILHTYTLIHDDLPCMDDDELRRGKPSCHIQFGEANALLAGDALLTHAFGLCAQEIAPSPYHPNQYCLELAKWTGSHGIIDGQIVDLESETKTPNLKTLKYIHLNKTAALIQCALRLGAISAGANEEQLQALTTYGEKIGLAFQIADDLLDETSTTEELGKPVGSDIENDKMTYVSLLGIDKAKEELDALYQEAIASLNVEGLDANALVQMAEYIIQRRN